MKRAWVERALLCGALLLAILAVDPRGEFPLNDDWNFALTTWKFAETGELQYSRFTAMTLKTQVLWGAAWTLALGKSFLVLRLSTLVLWIGVSLILDIWLTRLAVPAATRRIAVLALAFHPIVLWAAFTYMTQIPFLFCSIAALAAFHRGLASDEDGWLWVGALFTVGAYLIRQTGIALALAPMVVLVRHWRGLPSGRARKAAIVGLPVLLFVLLFVFTSVLEGYPGQIKEHFVVWKVGAAALPMQIARVVGYYSLFNLQNAGLFFAPLVVVALLGGITIRSRAGVWSWGATTLACVGGAALMILKGFPMPYWSTLPRLDIHPGNIFINFGLGPLTLRDTWTLGMDGPFALQADARHALTYGAAILGGGVLAILLSGWFRAAELGDARRTAVELSVAHCVVATAALLPSGIYFDRYCVDSLWSLAVLIPVLVGGLRRNQVAVATATLVIVGAFAVLSTQEYLEWNRARWQAYHDLRDDGVGLDRMDGGYEINQYLIGGFDGPILLRRSGFSVIDHEYVISFNRLPGYRVKRSYEFHSFLGLRRGEIHVLRRVPGYEP
jgi:hypothetical protein